MQFTFRNRILTPGSVLGYEVHHWHSKAYSWVPHRQRPSCRDLMTPFNS
uniref:Uncharacterized protein n=1 Tax=Anguilla anguilla TaxID=7936 RepID=A0A0E9UZJ0_ANGAN